MSPQILARRCAVVFIAAVCVGGYSSGDSSLLARVPVTGSVLLNGSPLAGATVQFEGPAGVRPGVGVTDTAGRFRLSSYGDGDGVPPGDYQIAVTKWEVSAAAQEDTSMEAAAARTATRAEAPKLLLPKHYADASQSGLKETVQAGKSNDFRLELKE